MRRIYRRQYFVLSKIFLISLITLIFLIILVFLNPTGNTCDQLESDFQKRFSSIPPRYLLIPYRQFAYRTAISCPVSIANEPTNNLSYLHPKYSPYLRGNFSFVLPYPNITYDDIEKFYPETSIENQWSIAPNISFENIPYQYENGMWRPVGIISAQRTALLVPLRGRDYNAKAFLLNIHAFLRRQLLTYAIIIIEQVHPILSRFNKGRLFNIGVHYVQTSLQQLNISCLILHDVDLIPEHDDIFYTCDAKHPKHTTLRVRKLNDTSHYSTFYEFLIGGVLLLTFDMYKQANGFSNLYWGWGGEDDDLSLRFIGRGICVVRPSYDIATYAALPHPTSKLNNARYKLLTWTIVRSDTDGYNNIETKARIINIKIKSTFIHLKVDVDADRMEYGQTPVDVSQPTYNKIYSQSMTINERVTIPPNQTPTPQ